MQLEEDTNLRGLFLSTPYLGLPPTAPPRTLPWTESTSDPTVEDGSGKSRDEEDDATSADGIVAAAEDAAAAA